jgi:hypothetical protein
MGMYENGGWLLGDAPRYNSYAIPVDCWSFTTLMGKGSLENVNTCPNNGELTGTA